MATGLASLPRPPFAGQNCPHRRRFGAPRTDRLGLGLEQRSLVRRLPLLRAHPGRRARTTPIRRAHRPSRHDSVLGYLAPATYAQSGHEAEKGIFDSAHDNGRTYDRVRAVLHGIPFIDLNGHLPLNEESLPNIVARVGRNPTPIDAYGRPQRDVGTMAHRKRSGDYHGYDCPALRAGPDHRCRPRPKACFGTTAHVRVATNGRRICEVARRTDAWEKEYDRRTTVEQSNNPKKTDRGLEHRKNRPSPIVASFYVLGAAMQHAIEWAKAVDGAVLIRFWLPHTAACLSPGPTEPSAPAPTHEKTAPLWRSG